MNVVTYSSLWPQKLRNNLSGFTHCTWGFFYRIMESTIWKVPGPTFLCSWWRNRHQGVSVICPGPQWSSYRSDEGSFSNSWTSSHNTALPPMIITCVANGIGFIFVSGPLIWSPPLNRVSTLVVISLPGAHHSFSPLVFGLQRNVFSWFPLSEHSSLIL